VNQWKRAIAGERLDLRKLEPARDSLFGSMSKSVSEVKQLSGAIADSLNGSIDQSGLVYIEEHESFPGFTRKRSGANFVYLDLKGTAIRDDEIVTRIKALAIPPAWTKVWICPVINDHLQATDRTPREENSASIILSGGHEGMLPSLNTCRSSGRDCLDYGG
jgi:hypothetical protein